MTALVIHLGSQSDIRRLNASRRAGNLFDLWSAYTQIILNAHASMWLAFANASLAMMSQDQG